MRFSTLYKYFLVLVYIILCSISTFAIADTDNDSKDFLLADIDELRSSNLDSALIIMDSLWIKSHREEVDGVSKARIAYTYGMVCARANKALLAIKYLNFARDLDSTNFLFDSYVCSALSEQYMFLGEYNTSLSFALKAYTQAFKVESGEYVSTCLAVIGNVYSQMKLYDNAHKYIDRAIEEAVNIEDAILYKYVKGDIYVKEDKFRQSARLMQQLLDELNILPKEELEQTYYRNPIELNYFKAELLSQMAYSLIMSEQSVNATKASKQAFNLIYPIPQIRMHVYLNLFNYLQEAKEWDRLIREVNRILPDILMGDSINNYNYILKNFLAEAYRGIGQHKQAYEYRTEANNLQILLAEKKRVASAMELGAVYETEQKNTQILQQRYIIAKQRNRQILLFAVLFLFSSIIIMVYFNLRRINNKNKKLFEQIQLLSDSKQQLNKLKHEKVVDSTKEESTESKLYDEIYTYLTQTKDYLNSDINRKSLASKLSTNETYLCNAIRYATELSFQNYIYQLRLEEAKQRLMSNSNRETIESIAYDCGFNSSRNFHRLFREFFGMTPTEFRKLAHIRAV